jgi:hypothetical protein
MTMRAYLPVSRGEGSVCRLKWLGWATAGLVELGRDSWMSFWSQYQTHQFCNSNST